jgi:hypothetical protein
MSFQALPVLGLDVTAKGASGVESWLKVTRIGFEGAQIGSIKIGSV